VDDRLLSPDVRQWIAQNTGADPSRLAFAKNPFPEIDYKILLNQVAARSRARHKLPTWFENPGMVYPSKVSVEQTSSEATAGYKSHLISGETLIDLTGGFGVDDFYFARTFREIVHCELNSELSDVARHNFTELGAANITCEAGDSSGILERLNRRFDWIYIDPSRRNDAKGKVFMLADCLPDVPGLLDFYFQFSDNILIKTAPLLDITSALSELKFVSGIHIVAVENEVKELLFFIRKDFNSEIEIAAVNLLKDSCSTFKFNLPEIHQTAEIGYPLTYLYEPNPAIYKSGAFDLVAIRFGLKKLHKHSHLYTSDNVIEDFPGRTFRILSVHRYDKANVKQFLQGSKSNVAIRNFPESVEKIRSKWKIADGGENYTFFTTVHPNDKMFLLCAKI